jgi:hypothetical protein
MLYPNTKNGNTCEVALHILETAAFHEFLKLKEVTYDIALF